MTIEKAIEKLKENYEYAKQQPWVQDHVSFALYCTWKHADDDFLKPKFIRDEYNFCSEVRDHDMMYEPTYDPEDGSM